MPVEVSPFDGSSASEADLAEHYAVTTAVVGLDHPTQSHPTLEQYAELIRRPRASVGPMLRWVAREGGRIVGHASAIHPEHENRHLTIARVSVLPERRRTGIGAALLRGMQSALTADGRRVVAAHGVKADAAGELWARGLGFVRTHAFVRQVLTLQEVDPALWQRPVADGFRLESWIGAAPEALLTEYARARRAMADAPNGEATYETEDWTPSRVRQHEADVRTQGVTSRVTVAVHEASGRVGALTELGLNGGGRSQAFQMDTAVVAEFRGHGLGLAIKGENLRWLVAEQPVVTEVFTQTAHNNEHMIRINLALGYETTAALAEVEMDAADLAERLARR